mgnify:CR=1 FL=1
METRSSNKRIDDLEKSLEIVKMITQDDFKTLGKRVVVLENFKLSQDVITTEKSKHSKWWSDNWFKIVTVFIISVPVIAGVYKLLES